MDKNRSLKAKIVSIKELEQRFKFIENLVLRSNLAIAFQYVIFLLSLYAEYDLQNISYSIYKNIIIYTASIVEGVILYKLKSLIESNILRAEHHFLKQEEYKDVQKLYEISDKEVICGARKIIKYTSIDDAHFDKLNKMARNCGMFDEPLYAEAEKIRKLRNKIHLASLNNTEDDYRKCDIDAIFASTKLILDTIERF